MSDTGYKFPGAVYSDYTNGDNMLATDGVYATLSDTNSVISVKNFGFEVPDGATITGVGIRAKGYGSVENGCYLELIYLFDDGFGDTSITSFTNVNTSMFPLSNGYVYAGGSTTYGDRSISVSQVNSSDFGAWLRAEVIEGTNYLDSIEMIIYYTEAGTEANTERGLYIKGYNTNSSEKGLYTQGYLTNSSERGLYIEDFVSDLYSRESASDLEGNDTTLETTFSEQDYTDVATDNDTYVDLEGTAQYMKFLFKEFNENETNEQKFDITWKGKSSVAPSTSPVYLQVYNRTLGQWETLDSDNSSSADTKFTLSGTQSTNLGDYYDANYVISVRVYQDVS